MAVLELRPRLGPLADAPALMPRRERAFLFLYGVDRYGSAEDDLAAKVTLDTDSLL